MTPLISGVALGVTVSGRGDVIALLVALIFHQGLEGVGLGSSIVKACFSMTKALVMILTYSLMTPMGIGIGIGIANTYDPSSLTALVAQVGGEQLCSYFMKWVV